MWRRQWLTLIAAILAIAVADARAADSEPPAQIEEIVVTALKRDTKLQDTPISITALTADSLAKTGATNFNDYYRSVPSLQVTESAAGQNRLSIRGINLPGESTVGVYYDETPVTGPSGTTSDPGLQTPNINLFDAARVEVLRGPQGTLYGSGSMGGTLKVIFNKPDASRQQVRIETQLATTEEGQASYFLNGAVNLPLITDKLAVRVAGYTKRNGGYVDDIRDGQNNVNRSTTAGGRVMLRYTPIDDLEIIGTALYQRNDFHDNSSWYAQLGNYNSDQALRQPVNDGINLFNGTLNWSLPFAKLTVASSYYKWDLTRVVDITAPVTASVAFAQPSSALCKAYNSTTSSCTPGQLAAYQTFAFGTLPGGFQAPLTVKSQTHEVRFASPGAGMFDWTTGLFYEDRTDHTDSRIAKGDLATGELLDPLVLEGERLLDTDVKQFAQFGEVSVRPFGGLTVTGGIRHYHYDKTVTGLVLQPSLVLGFFPGPASSVDASADGWVGKANVSYQFTRTVMAYAQWGQGFRPGGANNVPGLNQGLVAYRPDKLDSYELGLKTSFDESRYVLNLAAFQINLSDMQAALNVQPGFRIVTNAGDGRIRGAEAEGSAKFGGLTLSGGASYIPTAELTSAQAGGAIIVGAQNGQKGDRFPYTAKWSGTAAAEYDWKIAQLGVFARLDANYRGKQANEFRPSYAFYETLNGFTELNARIGMTHDVWNVSLFVNNVTGTQEPISIQSGLAVPPYQFERQQITPRPRTIGVNVGASF
jgi:iron complex outermembrane recepter protein